MRLHTGISFEIRLPLVVFGSLPPQFYFGSSVQSLPPLVHGFPYLNDALKIVRPGRSIPPLLIVRVLSSTLLPGFIGPESSVLPVNLPPSVTSSLRGLLVDSLLCVYGNLRQQDRRASLGKTHHLPVSRPASCQFGPPDIRPRSITPARPPPQHHLAGSLFATYTGSASCFLQTSHSLVMPLPCRRRPSVR